MEEKNEILAVMKEGFERIDQRFERVDQQFAKVDEQFKTLRHEFAEQLDGVSDGLHLEFKAQSNKLLERIESVRATIEQFDSKIGLMGENVANVMTEIGRYHATVETPLETRVTTLEGRVFALEERKSPPDKNSGTVAESRRGS